MERSVRAILRADIGQYESAMGRAAQATESVGTAAQKASQQTQQSTQQQTTAARSFSQRLNEHARTNEQAWTSVGTALLGVGAAGAGMLAVIGKTGISYNSLRQVATQGLTAITGSTEEAAAQMARLDEYGQTSWLMRDTLVEAQRRMTGFGIETSRVVPYIDALAEGVAAAGGSNQDFLELAEIMGQIQSQGRITAEELRRFGVRGIDAAQMIGDDMGMTGGEIREQITSGALDAETALDALAQGMMTNFEGSSDLVRDTFRGAVDDVLAAFRDLSANAMSLFVDPEGGGLFVGLMNSVSDFLFTLRDLPTPVLTAGAVILGLGTAATIAAGGFLTLYPRVLRLWNNLGALGQVGQTAQGAIRGVGRALPRLMVGAAVLGGLSMLVGKLAEISTSGSPAASSVDEVRLALVRMQQVGDLDDMFAFGGAVQDLDSALVVLTSNDVNSWMERLGSGLADVIPGFQNVHNPVREARAQFEATGDALAALVDGGNAELAAAQFELIAAAAEAQGVSTEELMALMPGYADALARVAAESELAADGTGELAGGLEEIDPAALAAAEAIEALTDSLADASTGFVDALGAWDAVIDKNRELAQSAAEESGKASASWEDYYDGHTVAIADYLDELQAQVDAQREWEANMTVLAGRVSAGTLDELAKLGPEGAPLVAALVDASDEELSRFEELMAAGSADAGTAFAASLIESIPLIRAAMAGMGDESIAELAERLRSGETTIQEEIDAWTFGPPAPIEVDVDTTPARSGFETVVDDFSGTTTDTGLDIDPSRANLRYNILTGQWEQDVTDTPLDIDPSRANLRYNILTGEWEQDVTDTNLDANDSPARGTVRGFGSWASTYPVSVNVTANVSAAQARIRQLNNQRVQVGADPYARFGRPGVRAWFGDVGLHRRPP
ncbi:tape measure protein [Sanguibacter sp. Z1732]|uniref:tape measure protein n=1 Tax=Sanguibacter sp. Z1732 TaxID=3435412 RepID=UPI003D9CBBD7